MNLARLRNLLESRWYSDAGPFLPLLPFEWIYGCVTRVRRFAYDAQLLRKPVLPVPVVVVGNVTVGGTGKTPVAAWLTRQLLARGYRPGIVSRGYGAQPQRDPVLVNASDTERFGDEPVMLAEQTGCPVCVCVDRVAAVEKIAKSGVDLVIADDGLQHYRMRRAVEIAVVDGERGFGNGHLLPAGPLREPATRAMEADIIVVNGPVDKVAGFQFRLQGRELMSLAGGATVPLGRFSGQRVWAVAGIGNPARFYRELRTAGIVIDEVELPDHGRTNLGELQKRRLQPVLMTEKDAVKYRDATCVDCWYMPVEAEFAAAAAASILDIVEASLALHRP